jgi:membrane associated rhomboid family serine protease
MLVALFVAASYGPTVLFGLIPLYPGVSWQSHLGGALGGILAARAAARQSTALATQKSWLGESWNANGPRQRRAV